MICNWSLLIPQIFLDYPVPKKVIFTMRVYKRDPTSRPYKAYTDGRMKSAVQSVRQGCSIREATKQFNVPYASLWNRLKGRHNSTVGRPVTLDKDDELNIAETVKALSTWNMPLSKMEIRMLVQGYLDKSGMNVSRFKLNLPGEDWVNSFLTRHNLTQRTATNIKPARAEISREMVADYFDNIEKELDGVPPQNICNYDETNFSNDPGAKKVVCQRGTRRVERVISNSKESTSVMFSGFADGTVLPLFVVYKGKNMYENWMSGGPPGARYAATESDWFDMKTFERWFFEIYLPAAKQRPGRHVLVGDNLRSHLSVDVVNACKEHGIRFVTLLPNATHLLQPLDVAFFRPAKSEWREILTTWRRETRVKGGIPKTVFPSLINQLIQTITRPKDAAGQSCEERVSTNLVAGFKATGLAPVDRQRVLQKMPQPRTGSQADCLSDAVIDVIQGVASSGKWVKAKGRGKKVPGKAIEPEDLEDTAGSSKRQRVTEDEDDPLEGCSGITRPSWQKKRKSQESEDSACGACGMGFEEDDSGAAWVACDNCDTWYCGSCVTPNQYKKGKQYYCCV